MGTTISLNQLQKSFSGHPVLRGINLSVNTGEIIGLIGPSGVGKSTVIKTMLGMEKADSGQALILNYQMPNRKVLEQIGYMAQSDALYERLTARENLAFFGQMKNVTGSSLKEQIVHVSTVVNLTDKLDQRVAGFSGGMKRRLSLAIALLGQPQLLILDEPTVGIDPALRRQIWHELALMRNQGRSILVTTHVMSEAELTDQVALLIQGKIQVFAAPEVLEKKYNVPTIEDVFLKVEKEAEK